MHQYRPENANNRSPYLTVNYWKRVVLGIYNFIYLFFYTLIYPLEDNNANNNNNRSWGGGNSGGSSGYGGGGGGSDNRGNRGGGLNRYRGVSNRYSGLTGGG